MIEHEKAVWRADEAASGETDEAATKTQQGPTPAAALNDEDVRRARFREALDHVVTKHHNVLAALAK